MKKIFKILFIILIVLNFKLVKAADFSTSISGTSGITENGTITLTFKANSTLELLGLKASLNYDSSKLSIVSSKAGKGFNLTLGSSLVVDSTSGTSGTFTFATITFKAKENFKIGDSTIVSLSNVSGSDGIKTYSGTASKINIKMKSTDNTLKDLAIDYKTITNFKSTTTSYTIVVNNNVSKVNISATPNDGKATVKGTGSKILAIYNNTFKIIVTSENGNSRTYTLNVIRKDEFGYTSKRSSDNTLKTLEIKNYTLDFDNQVNEYSLVVKNEIQKLEIIAVPTDNSAKVEVSDDLLQVGLNKIVIKVVAEDGSINEYILHVTRSNDNPQTTIDKFETISKSTTKETIEVLITKNQIITKKELEMIRNSNKNVIFSYYENNKLVYAWHLKNEDILTEQDFDTTITYLNDYLKNFEKTTNYAECISFKLNNQNKSKAKLKMFVDLENTKTNLYYYDESLKKQEELEVSNKYIEFAFLHSNYFVSRTNLETETFNIWAFILGIENLILVACCIFYLLRKNNKK